MMFYQSFDHNSFNHNPDPKYFIDYYEQFTTTKVRMVRVVQDVDRTNNTLLLQVSSLHGNAMWVNTPELLDTIQQGDIVEVYGTLSDGTHMTAEKLLISEQL